MATMTWTWTDALNAIGLPIDFEVFDELQSNINLVNAQCGTAVGTGNFSGSAGTLITVVDQGSTSYHVSVTPTADPGGYLGEVWVTIVSATQFRVKNSGSAVTAFSYKVSK